MKIFSSLIDVEHDRNSVVTVGTFDGVHLGHQKILAEVVRRVRERNGRSVVITFDPHPRTVFGKNPDSVRLLTTLEERIGLIQAFDPDILLIVPFTHEFSRLTARQFYTEWIMDGIGVAEAVEGYDHSFGRDGSGGIGELKSMGKEFGFTVDIMEPVTVGDEVVGSSRIRRHIEAGNVGSARNLLGRPYSLDGIVIRGKGRGRTLGFPTANIQPSGSRKLIPAKGVYAASAVIGGTEYPGMLNVGTRPTFEAGQELFVEIHLFDFNDDIYDRQARIRFIERIRDEQPFPGADALIRQLEQDAERCKTVFQQTFHE